MPAPRRPHRRTNTSHLLEAIRSLQDAETALGRIGDTDLGPEAQAAVTAMRRNLKKAKQDAADAIESLTGGALQRRAPTPIGPLFLEGTVKGSET